VIVLALMPLAARLYRCTGDKFVFGIHKKYCKTVMSSDSMGLCSLSVVQGVMHLRHSPHLSPPPSIDPWHVVDYPKSGDPSLVLSSMAKGKLGDESMTKLFSTLPETPFAVDYLTIWQMARSTIHNTLYSSCAQVCVLYWEVSQW
jgi:hypothetical protein